MRDKITYSKELLGIMQAVGFDGSSVLKEGGRIGVSE